MRMPENFRGDQNARFAAVLGMLNLHDAKVAERLKIGRTFLVRLRTGSSGISKRVADGMEAKFHVRVDWLLNGKGPILTAGEPEPGVEQGITG